MRENRWSLSEQAEIAARLRRMATHWIISIPVNRLLGSLPDGKMFSMEYMMHIIWAIEDFATDNVPHALYSFEYKLLPLTKDCDPIWQACVLLWSALCRIYSCDPKGAMAHCIAADNSGLSAIMPEFGIAKGMSYRLTGDIESALSALQPLTENSSDLVPWTKDIAKYWLIESRAVSGLKIPSATLRKLENDDKHLYHNTMGILPAALYRSVSMYNRPLKKCRSKDEYRLALNNTALFERPLLTMLLQDILPQPINGAEQTSQPVESYWW